MRKTDATLLWLVTLLLAGFAPPAPASGPVVDAGSAYDYLDYSLLRQGMDGVGGSGAGWGLAFSRKFSDVLYGAAEWDQSAMSAEFTGVFQHHYSLTVGARASLAPYLDLVGEASFAHLHASTDFYAASKGGYVVGAGMHLYATDNLQFDAFLRRTSLGFRAEDMPLNTLTTFGQTTATLGFRYRLDENIGMGVDYLRGSGNGLHTLMFVARAYF